MEYTPVEIIQYIREEDVKFIRLAFCDIYGHQKNMAIMPYELERAFAHGMPVDASAIAGFGDEMHEDLFLHPEASTLARLPWRPESGSVVRMFCNVTYADGRPFEADCRRLLKNAVEEAEAKGLKFRFGTEMEFYLFKTDELGAPTRIPQDQAGYMDIAPADKGENVRREVQLTLEQMGIQPESSHHELGPGQNEIDFKYSNPLSAADNAVTFQSVVRTIAGRNGLHADFSPKPLKDQPGSGLHINLSVESADGKDYLEQVAAGIMDKICDITLFLNPSDNSYERFGLSKAPKYISWSRYNRSQLLRIPELPGTRRRAELRSPDPLANPYLAMLLLMRAGMYGIDHQLTLPEPTNINLYDAPSETLARYRRLPEDRRSAGRLAAESIFVKDCLPDTLIRSYCTME